MPRTCKHVGRRPPTEGPTRRRHAQHGRRAPLVRCRLPPIECFFTQRLGRPAPQALQNSWKRLLTEGKSTPRLPSGALRAPDSLCISLSLSEWLPRRYFRQNDRIHSSSEGGWLKAKVPQDFPPARFARRISFVFPDCLRRTPAKSEYASGRIAKALFRAGIQKNKAISEKCKVLRTGALSVLRCAPKNQRGFSKTRSSLARGSFLLNARQMCCCHIV